MPNRMSLLILMTPRFAISRMRAVTYPTLLDEVTTINRITFAFSLGFGKSERTNLLAPIHDTIRYATIPATLRYRIVSYCSL
jgi:hypothetical protein